MTTKETDTLKCAAAGYRFKKTLRASQHDRPDIKQAREEWTSTRQPVMRLEPHRMVFLDETESAKTTSTLQATVSLEGPAL